MAMRRAMELRASQKRRQEAPNAATVATAAAPLSLITDSRSKPRSEPGPSERLSSRARKRREMGAFGIGRDFVGAPAGVDDVGWEFQGHGEWAVELKFIS